MTEAAQYYLYGETPVKMEVTPSGGLRVSVFDTLTGIFVNDASYRSRIIHDRDNLVRPLAAAEFERQVERLSRSVTRRQRPYRRMAAQQMVRVIR